MRSLRKDDRAMLFQLLIGAGMAIIIFFAIMNIGTYINGVIGTTLVDDYATNVASGSISLDYWDNATVSGSHKANLTCDASELTLASSKFYIYAGVSAVDFSLTVNGQEVNTSDNISEGEGRNITYTYLLSNSSINNTDRVITFDYTVTTDTSKINMLAIGTYYVSSDFRTSLENSSYATMINLSGDYDNVVDSLAVAAVVMAITLPLAAVVAIRKFF